MQEKSGRISAHLRDTPTGAMAEFIFQMQDVTRVHAPDKKVLSNVTLAFYFGAKIGVIGGNGTVPGPSANTAPSGKCVLPLLSM